MPKVICPDCESLATNVSLINGRKCYCQHCGWNADIAGKELRSAIKTALGVAAIGVILAIIARIRNPDEWFEPIAVMVAFLGLFGLWAAQAWIQLRKLGKVLPVTTAKRSSEGPQRLIIDAKGYTELARIARPRKLKMTWRARRYSGFAVLAVSLWTYFACRALWNALHGARSANESALILWSALIYGYSFVFFRNRWKEKKLLTNGELTIGHIIKQRNGRYTQSVEYSFKDAIGNVVVGRSSDASRSLYEGMSTAVFYDPTEPKRNISLECSLITLDVR